jgi:hypothetical protein
VCSNAELKWFTSSKHVFEIEKTYFFLAILFWTWQWKNIQHVIICNYVLSPFPNTTYDLFHCKHSNEKCHWQYTTMYYIHIYSHSNIQSANYTHVQPSMLMHLSFPLTFHFIACSFAMSTSIFLLVWGKVQRWAFSKTWGLQQQGGSWVQPHILKMSCACGS